MLATILLSRISRNFSPGISRNPIGPGGPGGPFFPGFPCSVGICSSLQVAYIGISDFDSLAPLNRHKQIN